MTCWLSVVGIGADGLASLPPAARALLDEAEVVVGGARHLEAAADVAPAARRMRWRQPLHDTVAEIAALRGRRVVVLATGDPMWFGVGATLARHFGDDELRVVPVPGAFSLAAARMRWPLDEVTCLSVHGRPVEAMSAAFAPGSRLLVLSEDGSSPNAVAKLLCERGYGASAMTVLEQLGSPQESSCVAPAREWSERTVADLNTIAIQCAADAGARVLPHTPGLPDDAFIHDGQITKQAMRAITVAALAPMPGRLLWDVGAGCGSVAIEWLRTARNSHAFAIERDAARAENISRNARALGVPFLDVVNGEAPAALRALDAPDAVFIGGGATAPSLIETCWNALRVGGRLVANVVTVDGEAALIAARDRFGGALSRVAVSNAEPLGDHLAWRTLRPVTQWQATKP